jgi:hypothetical protein
LVADRLERAPPTQGRAELRLQRLIEAPRSSTRMTTGISVHATSVKVLCEVFDGVSWRRR